MKHGVEDLGLDRRRGVEIEVDAVHGALLRIQRNGNGRREGARRGIDSAGRPASANLRGQFGDGRGISG